MEVNRLLDLMHEKDYRAAEEAFAGLLLDGEIVQWLETSLESTDLEVLREVGLLIKSLALRGLLSLEESGERILQQFKLKRHVQATQTLERSRGAQMRFDPSRLQQRTAELQARKLAQKREPLPIDLMSP